jgi:hypothetical protein
MPCRGYLGNNVRIEQGESIRGICAYLNPHLYSSIYFRGQKQVREQFADMCK